MTKFPVQFLNYRPVPRELICWKCIGGKRNLWRPSRKFRPYLFLFGEIVLVQIWKASTALLLALLQETLENTKSEISDCIYISSQSPHHHLWNYSGFLLPRAAHAILLSWWGREPSKVLLACAVHSSALWQGSGQRARQEWDQPSQWLPQNLLHLWWEYAGAVSSNYTRSLAETEDPGCLTSMLVLHPWLAGLQRLMLILHPYPTPTCLGAQTNHLCLFSTVCPVWWIYPLANPNFPNARWNFSSSFREALSRICAIFKYTLHMLFNFQPLNTAGEKPPLFPALSLCWPKSSRTRVGYFLPLIHSFPPTHLTVNLNSHHVERIQHRLSWAKGKLLWVHLTQTLALSQGLQGHWRVPPLCQPLQLCHLCWARFRDEAGRQAAWGNPWVVQKKGLGFGGASFSLQSTVIRVGSGIGLMDRDSVLYGPSPLSWTFLL